MQEWEREQAAATATMTLSATATEAPPRKHACADSFRPDCGHMLFVCKSNCSLPTHVPKVPAARPGAAADAGRGVTAGDCNSDHGFVCDCDCQPAAEAYADSFRSEGEHINLLQKRSLRIVTTSTLCGKHMRTVFSQLVSAAPLCGSITVSSPRGRTSTPCGRMC